MNIIFKLASAFLFPTLLLAQSVTVSVKWTKEEPYPICREETRLVYSDDKNLWLYRPDPDPKKCSLELMDRKSMASIRKVAIPVPAYIDALAVDGNVAVSMNWTLAKEIIKVTATSIDLKDGKNKGAQMIFQSPLPRFQNGEKILILPSPNKKTIGILTRTSGEGDKSTTFQYKAVDLNLKELASFNISLPLKNELFWQRAATVSNNGSLYIHGYEMKSKNDFPGTPKVYTYSADTKVWDEVKLPATYPKMYNFILKTDKDNNLEVLGKFYNKKSEDYFYNGIFYFKFNGSGKQVLANKKLEFDASKMSELAKKHFNPSKGLASEFDIKEVVTFPNNEQVYLLEYTYDFSNGSSRTLNHNAIVALKVGATGNLLNTSIIHKEQINYHVEQRISEAAKGSTNENLGSYIYLQKNNDMYFYYLDDASNTGNSLKELKSANLRKNEPNALFQAKLNSNGEVEKKKLFTIAEAGFIPVVGNAGKCTNSGFVANAYHLNNINVLTTKLLQIELTQ